MGAREGESLSRQTTTPLKPGGSVSFGTGSGDSADDEELYFSLHGLPAFLGSSVLGPTSTCTLAVALLPQLAESHRALSCGDHSLRWMQHLCPAMKAIIVVPPPFSFSLCSTGGTSGSSVSPLAMAIGVAGSSSGSPVGCLLCRCHCKGCLFGGLFCGGQPLLYIFLQGLALWWALLWGWPLL